jgi:hypothetical protein
MTKLWWSAATPQPPHCWAHAEEKVINGGGCSGGTGGLPAGVSPRGMAHDSPARRVTPLGAQPRHPWRLNRPAGFHVVFKPHPPGTILICHQKGGKIRKLGSATFVFVRMTSVLWLFSVSRAGEFIRPQEAAMMSLRPSIYLTAALLALSSSRARADFLMTFEGCRTSSGWATTTTAAWGV